MATHPESCIAVQCGWAFERRGILYWPEKVTYHSRKVPRLMETTVNAAQAATKLLLLFTKSEHTLSDI